MPTYHHIWTPERGFSRSAIMDIALRKARHEFAAYAALGSPYTLAQLLARELRAIWTSARDQRDAELARRVFTELPLREQFARSFELKAELARGAIPSDTAKAAHFDALAAQARAMAPAHLTPLMAAE